jgi:hypothetical protein
MYNDDGFPADSDTIILICDGSEKSKEKLKSVIDSIKLPKESIEIKISYKILKNYMPKAMNV